MDISYRTSKWWARGHYIVYVGKHADQCVGRVSVDDSTGTWSAYPEPLYPGDGQPLPEPYAEGMTRRSDAAKLLAVVAQVKPKEPLFHVKHSAEQQDTPPQEETSPSMAGLSRLLGHLIDPKQLKREGQQ